MSKLDLQRKKIQQLRSRRADSEERLYLSQLQLRSVESLLQHATRSETLPGSKPRVEALRARVSQLETRQQELNRQLAQTDQRLEKVNENERHIQFLQDKIAAAESQLHSPLEIPQTKQLSGMLAEMRRRLQAAESEKQRLTRLRREASAGRQKITTEKKQLQNEIAKLQRQLSVSTRTGKQVLTKLQTQRKQLQAAYEKSKKELAVRSEELQAAIAGIYADPHPRTSLGELNDSVPFLLIPIRIETRFVTVGRSAQLWVRIYPDDIAIHTHEKLLTGDEVTAGENYWKALFTAEKKGGNQKDEQKKAAWQELASRFGPQRAAWVARETKPVNWKDLDTLPGEEKLQFPAHDQTKTDAWSRAPRTRVLPDKFVVMLYEGETLVREEVGELIPDELIVGPDPLEAEASFRTENDKLLFGEAFDWASDFEKAVKVGMGMKIPLTPAQAKTGFEKILVLGVYLSADETEGQKRLEELIDNHHYSPKGFSLVLQGTPTNNTEQDGSGYTENDPFQNTSYFVETGDPLFEAETDCDGRDLADALGIEYGPLQYILNSNALDHRQAVLMNKALYPATLGYYFETLLQPVLTPAGLEATRNFFVEHVTGRGPLPSIRVGDQPYGVLLTSDFNRWRWSGKEADTSFLNTLYAVLSHYQQLWNGLLNQLMYVGKPGADPDTVLMNILGLQAGSVSFHQRTGYSTDYLRNLDDFQYGGRYAAEMQQNFVEKNQLLDFLHGFGYDVRNEAGLLKVPQALRLIYQHYTTLLDSANLVDNVPLSEKNPIRNYDEANQKNYLHWLAETTTIDALELQDFGEGRSAPNTLLYLQLRRALLLQLHKSSVDWFNRHHIALNGTLQPVNFHNIRPAGDLTKYEVLRANVGVALPNDANADLPVSEYLLTAGKKEAEAQYLVEMREALNALASASTARLERCLTEHLDACTYRLDAWQTGMFRLRLLEQRGLNDTTDREKRKTGIFLGAYGWLENVRPAPRQQVALDTVPEKLRPANQQPLFEYADNEGFVHTPSLNHASTAAILRSGYVSHADQSSPEVMAVNLSSERVRRALFLLSGMRNGQTLEALLGYQFERGLHDRASADDALKKLNLYMYDFRDKFPIQQHPVQQQGTTSSPTESLPAGNVVNGVALAEVTASFPYGATGAVTAATSAERQAIEQEKDKLADTLDALKDLLLAESTYQMVQGDIERAGAVLNALQEARTPPQLDVIHTPRSSQLTFTNRITLHFEDADPGLPANNPWQPLPMTPRARMEAGLNKWLGTVLGSPEDIVFRAAHLDAEGAEAGHLDMNAAELALQPIDLIYIAGDELNTGTADGEPERRTGASELESRIAYRYRQVQALEDEVLVRIEFMKPEAAGRKPLGHMLPLLRMLKSLIADSRPLHAGDFDPPSKSNPGNPENLEGYDVLNLRGRVEAAATLFQSYLEELGNLPITATVKDGLGNPQSYTDLKSTFAALDETGTALDEIAFSFDGAHIPDLQAVLIRLAGFDMPDAFPQRLSALSEEAIRMLLEQARGVMRRGEKAHARASALQAEAAAATKARVRVGQYIAAGKALLGEGFNILPLFHYNNESDIQQSHADRPQLLKYATDTLKMIFPADEWLQNVSHVRPKSARWDTIRTLAEAFHGDPLALHPVQLPYRAGDHWLAVEFPEMDELTGEPFTIQHDTLSVTVHGETAFAPAVRQCGLLIDDWTEGIPTQEEVTGITFNYDQPNASPPQVLLLAVTPQETGRWSWENLVGILNDTLQRAKRRAVEPLLLDTVDRPELGVLLPAIVADFSQHDLNIALDYRLNLKALLETIPILPVADGGSQ